MRVVLDTNVLLSGLAYPGSVPGKLVAAWRHGALDVVLSHFILEELRRVLPRLRQRHGLSDADIADLVDCLAFEAELVEPAQPVAPDLTDPVDLPVLGTLIASSAEYLVTGDKALLALAPDWRVLTPAQFWALHGA
jgi:putative PIN family toxin of toxin-antitoxin system